MTDLQIWLNEFSENHPKGTKEEFVSFVRKKEKEQIEIAYEQYKNKNIKFLKKGLK